MVSSTTRVRVRYAETDQMGIVYYANYLVWFEVGRTELLRSLGGTYRDLEVAGVYLPVITASCNYLLASRYDDELEIQTSGRLLSPIRLEFLYDVVRIADQKTMATGRTEHAALNPHGKPVRLPEQVRTALA
jgi:acyl-CoA thioester hydrolase